MSKFWVLYMRVIFVTSQLAHILLVLWVIIMDISFAPSQRCDNAISRMASAPSCSWSVQLRDTHIKYGCLSMIVLFAHIYYDMDHYYYYHFKLTLSQYLICYYDHFMWYWSPIWAYTWACLTENLWNWTQILYQRYFWTNL